MCFSTCFGSEARCNADLVFEWSRRSLKSLNEAREDSRHGCPKPGALEVYERDRRRAPIMTQVPHQQIGYVRNYMTS